MYHSFTNCVLSVQEIRKIPNDVIWPNLNSSPPTAAYMRQWIWSVLVQMMSCCLVPSHYLNRCWYTVNWAVKNKFQWNLIKTKNSKCIWKCCLQNSCHFVQGEMNKQIPSTIDPDTMTLDSRTRSQCNTLLLVYHANRTAWPWHIGWDGK